MGMIGQRFQQGRMEAGLTLSEVSEELNIEAKYIYALEEENYDDIPGKTFVLGYARSYATFLGLNSRKIMDDIAQEIHYNPKDYSKHSFFEEHLFHDDRSSRREKQRREYENQTKKNRKSLQMIVITIFILFILALLGSRLWY